MKRQSDRFRRPLLQRGITLIELMIALTLGLLLSMGIGAIFVNSSQAQREYHRMAQQIEDGRYAMDVLTQDVHHAGYYGPYFKLPGPLAAPDPCAVSDASSAISNALPFAIQAYSAADYSSRPDLSGTSCGTWLPDANLLPGSDVVVVRRADTRALTIGSTPTANEVYLQVNPVQGQVQFGAETPLTAASTANGAAATVLKRDGGAADIHKLHVHVYFVAPCSVANGGGAVCTGANDDRGQPVPTLKRLELTAVGGVTTMNTVTIAEGVEAFQVDYGIDDSPAAVNDLTGSIGDGAPDRYVGAPTAAEMPNIVTGRLHILTRNRERSSGHSDTKTFELGSAGTLGPFNDGFKRHAYVAVVRIINMSSRREIPS
ncbi:MAG TPA: PilW family protein [Burkholderiales bacterium]